MLNADRPRHQNEPSVAAAQPIGHVVSVRGSQATVGLAATESGQVRPTVGKFLGIRAGGSLLIGVITKVSIETPALAKEHGCHSTPDLDPPRHTNPPATAPPPFPPP